MGKPLEVIVRKVKYVPHSVALKRFFFIIVLFATFGAFLEYKTGADTKTIFLWLIPLIILVAYGSIKIFVKFRK